MRNNVVTVDTTMAQTIGALVERQRQIESCLDRLESKVDRLIWAGMGPLGVIIASIVVTIIR